jgi:ATP-dependent Clp protease adaptor protein ClpS
MLDREVWCMGRSTVVATAPVEVDRPQSEADVAVDKPWITIVWNDPVNLMSYVTYVFMSYFHYPQAQAHRLMIQVHEEGRAVVSNGSREEMERDVAAMHSYGLWATLAKDD